MRERATVVCRRGPRVLLVARDGRRWSLPGGALKRQEAASSAARRELYEQTTINAPAVSYLFAFGGLNKRHHVFEITVDRFTKPKPSNEIRCCGWFHWRSVKRLNTSLPSRYIVELAFGQCSGGPMRGR
ncbi:NUDIX hydrolase [Pandoraea oxalativorans]|uniref:NUDIX hydrolase n=1 Tax=Pandoraea oxalativorans TaxID=573737 RepID=UPI000A0526CC|nr:NUDIX domain-containing protein [Pandoraea oxalativorans]